jgi:hypothetical protein
LCSEIIDVFGFVLPNRRRLPHAATARQGSVPTTHSWQMDAEHRNLLVTGPCGVGKSWLSCALAQKACRDGYTVLYARLPWLFATPPSAPAPQVAINRTSWSRSVGMSGRDRRNAHQVLQVTLPIRFVANLRNFYHCCVCAVPLPWRRERIRRLSPCKRRLVCPYVTFPQSAYEARTAAFHSPDVENAPAAVARARAGRAVGLIPAPEWRASDGRRSRRGITEAALKAFGLLT